MQPEIVCLGEPMLEFNQQPDGLYRFGHGGDASNCAVAAARQGARSGMLTRIGEDRFGDALLDLWAGEGVDAARVERDRAAPTAIYFVTHDAEGHAFSYFRAGSAASRMTPAFVPGDYIAGARILHLSGISQAISDSAADTGFHAIELARQAGVSVSYDPNFRAALWPLDRARAIIHGAMARCDIALPGLDDAIALTGLRHPDAIADFYLELGASVLALTLGAEGTLVATAAARETLPGHRVEAVDATGAGDTFDGSFLARIAAGDDPFAAARYANAAAALATTGYGAVAPMPDRAAVEDFLKERQ